MGASETKAFYAWTVIDGVPTDVTAQSAFSTSNGSMNGNVLTASGSPSSGVGTDWVKATYGGQTTDAAHDCDLTVVKVNLVAEGVAEDDEENPGAFVRVNNNDSDGDGVPDNEDPLVVGGDPDLLKITLQPVLPQALPQSDKVRLSWEGARKIRVFASRDRTERISWGKEYGLGALPVELYVEGAEASDSLRDVAIKLTYVKGGAAIGDRVNLTVVGVDLTVGTVAERHETDPGAFVRLNTDDDNNNNQPDTQDAPNAQEDDLVKMTLAVRPGEIDGAVTMTATQGKVKVWESATKEGDEVSLPPDPAWTTATMPEELYLEGCEASTEPRDVQLVLQYSGHGLAIQDMVNVTVIGAVVKEVSFKGAAYHMVKKDDGTVDFVAPHWKDINGDGDAEDEDERHWPVAYQSSAQGSDSYMFISVRIEAAPAAAFVGATLIAENEEGYSFTGSAAPEGSILKFAGDDVRCEKKFDLRKVGHLNPLTLNWKVLFGGGVSSCDIGKTRNVVYVTWKCPTADPLFETPLRIGCENAKGQTVDTTIISAIWGEFTDLNVLRMDRVQMKYWATANPPQSLSDMLKAPNGDGSCMAWSELLDSCMKSQGLGDFSQILEVVPDTGVNPQAIGFLVKNWNFDRHIRSGPNGEQDSEVEGDDEVVASQGPDTPVILPGPDGVLESMAAQDDTYQDGLHAGTRYPYEMDKDAREQHGVPAQGNNNPISAFHNHFVCKINGQISDSSYGIGPYATENAHENAAIDGICNAAMHCKKNDANHQELSYSRRTDKE